jgi:hypothetical protein
MEAKRAHPDKSGRLIPKRETRLIIESVLTLLNLTLLSNHLFIGSAEGPQNCFAPYQVTKNRVVLLSFQASAWVLDVVEMAVPDFQATPNAASCGIRGRYPGNIILVFSEQTIEGSSHKNLENMI